MASGKATKAREEHPPYLELAGSILAFGPRQVVSKRVIFVPTLALAG